MTERKKDLSFIASLLVLLLLFYAKILFTDKVISAPDIINESYWGFVAQKGESFLELFDFSKVQAGWNVFINSGTTSEGGISPIHFLFWHKLIGFLFPLPSSVAWHIVLHLFSGATGLYLYCRAIGVSRPAAFLAGLIFAVAPENASLINAGHVMKIATISYAPWAFYFLERGFLSRRAIFFLATGLILALQFFNTHWQIAYYTCLCLGLYGLFRSFAILRSPGERAIFTFPRLFGMNLVVMFFFLSTVSIALLPLANWAKDTNRGVHSGANQGKGGLDREEAMSWSLPPEEITAFVIPGFFGLSRQEGGANPENIASYYWGRMHFTQTASYMGLLPWLLLPLPLIFRRNRYTWLAVVAVGGGILFSMGKYTPFYNFLFDYFPGINRFRVPKMIMFIPVMGLGVLSAMGLDLLLDPAVRSTKAFKNYVVGMAVLPVALVLLLVAELIGSNYWISQFIETLAQPTRYEPQSEQLVLQRWNNLVVETGLAAGLATLFAGAFGAYYRGKFSAKVLLAILLALFLADVGRIDNKFLFTINVPEKNRQVRTPVMDFIGRESSSQYRVLPMDGGDPMHYVSQNIPVMYTSNAVQQQRWQDLLDNFSTNSTILNILNVKYLIFSNEQYTKEKTQLGGKFSPVFQSPDGLQVVLENREVMPKAWLVPSVFNVTQPQQALGVVLNPQFDPRQFAVVETPPTLQLAQPGSASNTGLGDVLIKRYEGEQIDLSVTNTANALLVLGEKYYRGWKATVDGKQVDIQRVNYILRGVYLTPGTHKVEFRFDPLPFKIGKFLTLGSFALFAGMLIREWLIRRKKTVPEG